eukprot:scaffold15499_cov29-Tisochrysis_lutea.AAC.2
MEKVTWHTWYSPLLRNSSTSCGESLIKLPRSTNAGLLAYVHSVDSSESSGSVYTASACAVKSTMSHS